MKAPQKTKNKNAKFERRKKELQELKQLKENVDSFVCHRSYLKLTGKHVNQDVKLFTDLPLSKQTLEGLKKAHFVTLTDIQRKALPLALKGKDILGAAKTGSGKTLAFILPVLEILFQKQWTPFDGLGALIISPTRELVWIPLLSCDMG